MKRTQYPVLGQLSIRQHTCDMTGQDGIHKLSSMRANQMDKLSLKCSVKASSPAFKSSFFFRTHLLWNVLPLGIKEASTLGEFESKLKHHMWDVILDPL